MREIKIDKKIKSCSECVHLHFNNKCESYICNETRRFLNAYEFETYDQEMDLLIEISEAYTNLLRKTDVLKHCPLKKI